MKHIICIFFIVLALNMSAQYGGNKMNYGRGMKMTVGKSLTLGGGIFLAAGLLTPSSVTYTNGGLMSNSKNVQTVTPPIWEQGAKTCCIATGITLTISGLITMLYEHGIR